MWKKKKDTKGNLLCKLCPWTGKYFLEIKVKTWLYYLENLGCVLIKRKTFFFFNSKIENIYYHKLHKNTAFIKTIYRKIIDYIVIIVGHHTIAVLSAKASEKLIFLIKISIYTTTCLWKEIPSVFLTDQRICSSEFLSHT